MSEILDSGKRRNAGTGSVRDVSEGKGRFDLTPLNVVGRILGREDGFVLKPIELYKRNGDTNELINSIKAFIQNENLNPYDYMIQISQHYERGCQKYGDRNWEKGQPLSWYIDSGTRHYHKYKRGDKDERHDLAYGWNLISCAWTQEFKPEMIDLPFKGIVSPAPTESVPQIPQDEPIKSDCIPADRDTRRICLTCKHCSYLTGRYRCIGINGNSLPTHQTFVCKSYESIYFDSSPPLQERRVRDIAPNNCPHGRVERYDDDLCSGCSKSVECWTKIGKCLS